jgi:hypothetical protein
VDEPAHPSLRYLIPKRLTCGATLQGHATLKRSLQDWANWKYVEQLANSVSRSVFLHCRRRIAFPAVAAAPQRHAAVTTWVCVGRSRPNRSSTTAKHGLQLHHPRR